MVRRCHIIRQFTVRRTRKTPPKRRSPLLLADVRTLLEAMRPSMGVWPVGMAAHRDAALLLMGFAGAHRRSELVGLHLSDVTVHPVDGLHVRVRSSKTDQEGVGVVRALPYGRDPLTCPPCALVRWRRLLLAYVVDDGGRHSRSCTSAACRPSTSAAASTTPPAGPLILAPVKTNRRRPAVGERSGGCSPPSTRPAARAG